jgi:hypothetical protein
VGAFTLASWVDAAAAGLPALAMAVMLARHFGRFNGGNLTAPPRS